MKVKQKSNRSADDNLEGEASQQQAMAAGQQRWLRRYILNSLSSAIAQADAGNVEPLNDYLCEALPDHDAEQLSEFLRYRLEKRGPGNSSFPNDRSPSAEAEREIESLVRTLAGRWRNAHGGKNLPKGWLNECIIKVTQRMAESGELRADVFINPVSVFERITKKKVPKTFKAE